MIYWEVSSYDWYWNWMLSVRWNSLASFYCCLMSMSMDICLPAISPMECSLVHFCRPKVVDLPDELHLVNFLHESEAKCLVLCLQQAHRRRMWWLDHIWNNAFVETSPVSCNCLEACVRHFSIRFDLVLHWIYYIHHPVQKKLVWKNKTVKNYRKIVKITKKPTIFLRFYKCTQQIVILPNGVKIFNDVNRYGVWMVFNWTIVASI